MRFLFTLIALAFLFVAGGQVDPQTLDSLKASMARSGESFRQWQDSFAKKQDSIYRQAISRAKTSHDSLNVIQQQPVKTKRTKQLPHMVMALSLAIIVLVVVLVIKRRNSKKSRI